MELNKLLIAYSSCVGLFTFLLGLVLGHRLALGRDIRKEKIVASKPIRAWIIKRKEYGNPSDDDHINPQELDNYLLTLSNREKNKFNRIYADYLSFIDKEDNKTLINPYKGTSVIGIPYYVYNDGNAFLKKLDDIEQITRHS